MEFEKCMFSTQKFSVFMLLWQLTQKYNKFNNLCIDQLQKLNDVESKMDSLLQTDIFICEDYPLSLVEVELLSNEVKDIKYQYGESKKSVESKMKSVIEESKKLVIELVEKKKQLMFRYNKILMHFKRNTIPSGNVNSDQHCVGPIVAFQKKFHNVVRSIHGNEKWLNQFFMILSINGLDLITATGYLPPWLNSVHGTVDIEAFINADLEATYIFGELLVLNGGKNYKSNFGDDAEDSANV
ncbi:uncharacterized protein LOC119690124 [Teleopsis dalmanni]|uniref:uncharacterized protein LOC119690124 n=1 Tax=Teleopsis dalmanni TaxID=139649 RepID=UPI0018CE0A41|nr:uncharacterized protein LOC119690124 [Teleopsis dalmanni]